MRFSSLNSILTSRYLLQLHLRFSANSGAKACCFSQMTRHPAAWNPNRNEPQPSGNKNPISPQGFAIEASLMESEGFADTTVTGIGHYGFRIGQALHPGSLILFKNSVLNWKVDDPAKVKLHVSESDKERIPLKAEDLKIEHFKFLEYVRPRTELLILGTGEYVDFPNREVMRYLKENYALEIQNSRQAAGTFTMLNLEGRIVTAALLATPLTEYS